MPDTTPRILTCPTCGRRVKWTASNPDRPFCSERCKLIDLGAWADGQHSIPGDAATGHGLSRDPDPDPNATP